MMHSRTRWFALMVIAGLAVLLGGCGGGDDDDFVGGTGTMGTAGVEGAVYAPAAVGTAQAGPVGPVARCRVQVRTEPGGQQLAYGVTDDSGRYCFRNLPAETTVAVVAEVPECEPLLARLRLRTGMAQANVTVESTLACICARHSYAYGGTNGQANQEFAGQVAEECLQYQAQNGYRYRNGERPEFGTGAQLEAAAGELLASATGDALQQARQTRAQGDCEFATRMMLAHACQGDATQLRWSEQVVAQIAQQLQQGEVNAGDVAPLMARIMNREVTAEQVQSALQYLWHRLGYGEQSRAPELVEIVGAMTCACGDQDMLRIRTQDQLRQVVDGLSG